MLRVRVLLTITVFICVALHPLRASYLVGEANGDSDSYQAMVRQAEAKMLAQEWANAAALWQRATEMNPHFGSNWTQLATAQYRAGNYAKAIAAYEMVYELGVGYPFNALYNIARCHARMGDKEKALRYLERALEAGFRNLRSVQTDDDLKVLHDDVRFKKLAAIVDTGKMTRIEGWRYDLWLLARELQRLHYDPYRQVSKPVFEAYVNKLHNDISKLSDHQIEVGLMKLARLAGDGHTGIAPLYAMQASRKAVPVQFYLFTEGLFIIAASPKYADLVGAQVLGIGTHTVDQALAGLDPIISQDNKMWPKLIAPGRLIYPQLLNGLGLLPQADALPLTIKDAAGNTRSVTLPVESGGTSPDWPTARKDSPNPEPLYLKKRQEAYWFEYLSESKTVFFQYNQVRSDVKEPLDKFCERLFQFINDNAVERLVIDMRWNGGGNNFLNKPLINGLIRTDKINQRGKLFVIVGRNTFSAAMCGATQIERYSNAIFVGEPTGSSPNFIGESIGVNLPYSKMSGSVSDLYWQNSVAMDYRTWIAPQIYAPPSFALYRLNRDPAMEAIMAYQAE